MEEKADQPIDLFVVHWNRPAECIATVRSFLGQGLDLKVTVIDNCSTAKSLDALRLGLNSNIEILQLSENKGWGPALNVALQRWIEVCETPWCFISAHDAVPAADCLSLLIAGAKQDEQIGIACPQYPDETIACLSPRRAVYQERGSPRPRGTAQPVDVPHGTLMLVRRKCLVQIGLFDERYFAYGDEHELGARARRRGWKVVLVWGAMVTNPGTWTPSPVRSYLFTRNSLLLVRDYYGCLPAFIRALLISVNTLRLVIFSPQQAFAFSARARIRGIRDYALGRFGRPAFSRE